MADVVVLGAGLSGTLMAYELAPQLRDGDTLTDGIPDAAGCLGTVVRPVSHNGAAVRPRGVTAGTGRQATEVAARLGVRGIPAMFLLNRGRVVAHTAGAMNAEAIVRWARGNLS